VPIEMTVTENDFCSVSKKLGKKETMKNTSNLVMTTNDRLKVCYWDREKRKIYTQRKRTSFKSEAVKMIQEKYAVSTIEAVRYIRDVYGLSLRDCLNILNYLRREEYFEANYLSQFN
jgi:hypothetical protein